MLDKTLHSITKKILIVIMSSGLFGQAIYIYGLSYYQGYIHRLGFEYAFFPLSKSDTALWTYYASRELGASTILLWSNFTTSITLSIFFVVFCIIRLWMASGNLPVKDKKEINDKQPIPLFVSIDKTLNQYVFCLWSAIKWLFNLEKSIWAFLASYVFLLILFFIPIFLSIWIYFPLLGYHHGEGIAQERLQYYETSLCGDKDDYWNECISLPIQHLNNYKVNAEKVYGRIILKHDNLLGIVTKNGAVTMTIPHTLYHRTIKNNIL